MRLSDGSSELRLRFPLTIFLGAFLLFQVQPIMGRYILPWFGGGPAVWSNCLLFFQVALLGGYAYAHWLGSRRDVRLQAFVHIGLLLGSLFSSRSDRAPPPGSRSGRQPLRQDTISARRHRWRSLPAVVGNWPALAALAYPNRAREITVAFVCAIEPGIVSRSAQLPFRAGAVLAPPLAGLDLVGLVRGVCSFVRLDGVADARGRRPILATRARRRRPHRFDGVILAGALHLQLNSAGSHNEPAFSGHCGESLPVGGGAIGLSVHLYPHVSQRARLSTYFFCNCRRSFRPHRLRGSDSYRYAVDRVAVGFLSGRAIHRLHACHGELARSRPPARYLTQFYLAIAAGGAIGGIFVALVAPRIFSDFSEYPIALAASCLLAFLGWLRSGALRHWTTRNFAVRIPLMALLLGGITAIVAAFANGNQATVASARNFYGVLRVTERSDSNGPLRELRHGQTRHGLQYLTEPQRSWATSYYGPHSGIAMALNALDPSPRRVAIVGLGAGTMAAWGRRGDTFRFYEINPDVESIARKWFTYLKDSLARTQVVLGDARIQLEREATLGTPDRFDVIAVDAFSSDAIPVHLLDSGMR